MQTNTYTATNPPPLKEIKALCYFSVTYFYCL